MFMLEVCVTRNGKDVEQLLEDVRTAREAFCCATTENKKAMEQRFEEALRELADFCRVYDSLG
jgi:hypothetical protein